MRKRISKWARYEREKRKLARQRLSEAEYQKRVREIAQKLKL